MFGYQEAPQQNPRTKKMPRSTWKFDTHIAHLQHSYLGLLLELEVPHEVQILQNDRNGQWSHNGRRMMV